MRYVHSGDWGVDDAIVSLMADNISIRPEVVIPGEGCGNFKQVFQNLLGLYKLLGWTDRIPIYLSGAKKYVTPLKVETFFGKNGFNDIELDISETKTTKYFPMIDDDWTWFETGPCTNLAHFLLSDDPAKINLKRIVIMGGVFEIGGLVGKINPETKMPFAEFNFYQDARAVQFVIEEASKLDIAVEIVSWDECVKIHYERSFLEAINIDDKASSIILNMTRKFFEIYGTDNFKEQSGQNYSPADSVAFMALIGKYVETQDSFMSIHTDPNSNEYGLSKLCSNESSGFYPIKRVLITDVEKMKTEILENLEWI